MRIYKNIKIYKTKTRFPLSYYSDKHRFWGEPFETIGRTYKTLNEALKEAKKFEEEIKKRHGGFLPYLVLAVTYFGETDIFAHRWGLVNPITRELTEDFPIVTFAPKLKAEE